MTASRSDRDMNPDPEVQARRAAKRARPEDRRRRLRRYTSKIASTVGLRIAQGKVRGWNTVYAIVRTMCDTALFSHSTQELVRAAHQAGPDADLVSLMCEDALERLQWFGADRMQWPGFDVRDPKTWPARNP